MTRRAVLTMLFAAGFLPAALGAATRLVVTVIEQKTGKPVLGLQAADFSVLDDKTPRAVEAAEYSEDPVDVMLLVDSSLVGPAVQPAAASFIGQLREKEQMAIVSFDSSASLIQDFTSSHQLLQRALGQVKYGNSPRVLDALYAALDGGFEHSLLRRVVLLVTAGVDAPSRMSENDVLRLARKNAVAIYPVFPGGYGRGLYEKLARNTGGASFNLRDMRTRDPGPQVFEVVRSNYKLTVAGNLALGDKLKVEVKGREKLQVSALPE